jgi:hypothetical protein
MVDRAVAETLFVTANPQLRMDGSASETMASKSNVQVEECDAVEGTGQ